MTHIKLTRDFSAKSYVICLKQFTRRKEMSKLMISDKRKYFEESYLKTCPTIDGINWKFNLARAP